MAKVDGVSSTMPTVVEGAGRRRGQRVGPIRGAEEKFACLAAEEERNVAVHLQALETVRSFDGQTVDEKNEKREGDNAEKNEENQTRRER